MVWLGHNNCLTTLWSEGKDKDPLTVQLYLLSKFDFSAFISGCSMWQPRPPTLNVLYCRYLDQKSGNGNITYVPSTVHVSTCIKCIYIPLTDKLSLSVVLNITWLDKKACLHTHTHTGSNLLPSQKLIPPTNWSTPTHCYDWTRNRGCSLHRIPTTSRETKRDQGESKHWKVLVILWM